MDLVFALGGDRAQKDVNLATDDVLIVPDLEKNLEITDRLSTESA
jgi:hypothetical protein